MHLCPCNQWCFRRNKTSWNRVSWVRLKYSHVLHPCAIELWFDSAIPLLASLAAPVRRSSQLRSATVGPVQWTFLDDWFVNVNVFLPAPMIKCDKVKSTTQKVIRFLMRWKSKTSLWHPKRTLEIAGPGCHKSSSWHPGQWEIHRTTFSQVFQETVLQPPGSMLKPCWLNLWTAQLCSLCADPGCKCITTCIPPLRRRETGASLA